MSPLPSTSSMHGAKLRTGYVIMVWFLVMHRNNFTFTFYTYRVKNRTSVDASNNATCVGLTVSGHKGTIWTGELGIAANCITYEEKKLCLKIFITSYILTL
jgi:hypothetical protein